MSAVGRGHRCPEDRACAGGATPGRPADSHQQLQPDGASPIVNRIAEGDRASSEVGEQPPEINARDQFEIDVEKVRHAAADHSYTAGVA